MDNSVINIFKSVGIPVSSKTDMIGVVIPREELLNMNIYNSIRSDIIDLKLVFSSSAFTCLHKDASKAQKWPLLNLVRQLLLMYGMVLEPLRKADGYTKEGVKKFKRFFVIKTKKIIKTEEVVDNDTHILNVTI